jgi:hypothetical protein
VPLLQNWEQQSPAAVHGLPAVRQVVLSGTHTPAAQLPLQQAAESLHAWASATQDEPHVPALQLREQHSVDTAQGPPAALH